MRLDRNHDRSRPIGPAKSAPRNRPREIGPAKSAQPWDSDDVETLRWQVGDATVFRIGELDATAALQGLIPEFDLADISGMPGLTPDFVDRTGRLRGMVQAFLIVIAGQKIIVDPGVGNGKKRTAVPGWDNLQTNFLDRLQAAGAELSGIEYVVNTHLHFDHVGWHTRLIDGAWQPSFTAARYVMSAEEFAIGSPGLRMRSPISMPGSPTLCCRCTRPDWSTWLPMITSSPTTCDWCLRQAIPRITPVCLSSHAASQ